MPPAKGTGGRRPGSETPGSSKKRPRRTFESPDTSFAAGSESGNEILHSTAILSDSVNSDNGHLANVDFGSESEILGSHPVSQRSGGFLHPASVPVPCSSQVHSQQSRQTQNRNRAPSARARPPSPVVFTASTGNFVFSGILQKHGYFLSKDGNLAHVSPLTFRKTMTDWVTKSTSRVAGPSDDLAEFIDDMKKYLRDRENLLSATRATEHKDTAFEPSLLHYLLGVIPLQKHVFGTVFPTLAELSYIATDDEVAVFREVLNQMKWLPHLDNGEKITKDFLELLENSTVPKCQEELIKLLPHIVPTTHHKLVGETLKKMLEDFDPLCKVIMECFCSIDLPPHDLEHVRQIAVDNMAIAEPKEIPIYMAFLLSEQDQETLSEVIADIREKFVLKRQITIDEELKAAMKTLADKISFYSALNDDLSKIWIQQICDEYTSEPAEFKPLDLLMLLIFAKTNKTAEAPLRALFMNDMLAEYTFREMIDTMPTVIDHVFKTAKEYCEKLMWSGSTKLYKAAAKVLTHVFDAVSDTHAREILRTYTISLVHCNDACRDQIIEALTKIVNKNRKRFLRFTNQLMATMDYVIKLSPQHIRGIVRILAAVAYIPEDRDSERFETEFFNLLRKQLSQSDENIRSIGVIAAVAAIDQLVRQNDVADKLKELVNLVWEHVENENLSCWIFFDEMAKVVADHELLQDNGRDYTSDSQRVADNEFFELSSALKAKFMDNWLVEGNSITQKRDEHGLSLQILYNAQETILEEDGSVRDPLIMKFQNNPTGLSTNTIAAHVRLMCSLEYNLSKGVLDEVDVIIGCPYLIPDLNRYLTEESINNLSTTKKNALGRYLINTINYTRELISAFASQKDTAARFKVFIRLNNLVDLQKKIVFLVSCWNNENPVLPFAYALERNVAAINFASASKKKKKAASKLKLAKAPISSTLVEDTNTEESDDDGGLSKTVATAPVPIRKSSSVTNELSDDLQPSAFRPFLRRLHPNVFRLLKYKLEIEPPERDYLQLMEDALASDEENNSKLVEPVSILTPETLVLLLEDMIQQVSDEKLTICIVNDIGTLLNPNLLKHMCCHLDTLIASIAINFLGWSMSKKKEVETSVRLVYTVMRKYMEALGKLENRHKRDSALEVLADHLGDTAFSAEKTVTYFVGEPDLIKNPSTALEQVSLLKMFYDVAESDDRERSGKAIGDAINNFLKRQWKLRASEVLTLLKVLYSTSNNPLEEMHDVTVDLMGSDTNVPRKDTDYRSCTGTNFHAFYRGVVESFCTYVARNMRKKITNLDEALKLWTAAFEIFQQLVDVIQLKPQAMIITPLLRNCRFFLDTFTNQGINLLPMLWKTDPDQAKKFLRQLQGPTRKIQYICEHCKVNKNTNLIRFVPRVKKSLEALVFRVREILALHGAPNAFWMGSLKHRNLEGNEIDSQIDEIYDEDLEEEESEDDHMNSENLFEMPRDLDEDSN